MKLDTVINAFVYTTIKSLNARSKTGAKFFVETKKGRYLNFRPRAFRSMLKSFIGRENENEYLDYFRRLKLIIVDRPDRFTNIQWINKKSTRVITVDKEIFDTIFELVSKGDAFEN